MSSSTRLRALAWLLTVEFFVTQFIAQAAWPAYSMIGNDISLLGVTTCGAFANPAPDGIADVCSPLNLVFNAGMAINGLLVLAGVWLTRDHWPKRRSMTIALWLLALGGLGSTLAGVFPLNLNLPMHATGAILALLVAAFGFFAVSAALWQTARTFALYSALTGLVAIIGFLLYGSQTYLGLGRGVIERIAAWPHTLWYMTTGILLLTGKLGPLFTSPLGERSARSVG